MKFRDVEIDTQFNFHGTKYSKSSDHEAMNLADGLHHAFYLDADVEIPTTHKDDDMKFKIISRALSVIIPLGVIVCWGKLHGVDFNWDEFVSGWFFENPPEEESGSTARLFGILTRFGSEVVGVIASGFVILWSFVPEDRPPSMRHTLRKMFWR
jgi:hypothetical protein